MLPGTGYRGEDHRKALLNSPNIIGWRVTGDHVSAPIGRAVPLITHGDIA